MKAPVVEGFRSARIKFRPRCIAASGVIRGGEMTRRKKEEDELRSSVIRIRIKPSRRTSNPFSPAKGTLDQVTSRSRQRLADPSDQSDRRRRLPDRGDAEPGDAEQFCGNLSHHVLRIALYRDRRRQQRQAPLHDPAAPSRYRSREGPAAARLFARVPARVYLLYQPVSKDFSRWLENADCRDARRSPRRACKARAALYGADDANAGDGVMVVFNDPLPVENRRFKQC
jgi:hypothetical protein